MYFNFGQYNNSLQVYFWRCLCLSFSLPTYLSLDCVTVKLYFDFSLSLGIGFHGKLLDIDVLQMFLPEALWPTDIVIPCECVSVCQLLLIRTIKHHPLKLGSPNISGWLDLIFQVKFNFHFLVLYICIAFVKYLWDLQKRMKICLFHILNGCAHVFAQRRHVMDHETVELYL